MTSHPTLDLGSASKAVLARGQRTAALPEPGFPHYADMDTGEWTRSPNGDWTGGFFVGQLWLAAATGSGDAATARAWTERVRPRAASDTIFRGFLFWYGAALGSVLTGDQYAEETALEGAYALAESFNPAAGLLPLGSTAEEAHSVGADETNIDGVPGGAPLLYWAADVTGDETLRRKARSHVARHIELLVRDDDSVVQSATFDTGDGALIKTYTHKGVRDDSTWARAQAWAMLGIAQAARHEPELFTADAVRVCDWWCAHLPESRVAHWDFDAPQHEPEPLPDTSATAIAAAALLKMRTVAPAKADQYEQTAREMVTALVEHHLSPPSENGPPAGILGNACYNHRIGLATRNELVWGTYFLLEALLTFTGELTTDAL
ncbi:glycoside hydrolase family 88 protein [Streptomyces winkii]|uniref:glycoside hydrolase family 88 protein n=1 Tax=Streptomyces winkii TaxID=3051178 RepID=UPI0028D486C7|nr:glycoside hydrolase family 88 protein [Streptomyces sp. DSM 40971]